VLPDARVLKAMNPSDFLVNVILDKNDPCYVDLSKFDYKRIIDSNPSST
jgi:hypothetical protein